MKNIFKRFLSDERGNAFIENGLWIIVVVLLVAGAGYALANQGIKSKFDQIQNQVTSTPVPNISGQ
ncbi:Flp family type IVb pilin [Desulfofundulus sp. TPOSR]|uniref:Flp family type IVb pilin n=1 Tax=Desulfofundulus sp. TPOSR TaxID=2714340 RepID=UPI00140E7D7B|nr:Flp family type IVb pilin [Desulfofundulus sp. TPOSR]NHM26978.1 Flp family type IVb pilin [Desulfofundulus sp. TPOSR]